jgi:murein DD-endopeptidase MepM/ murein hydrolase activator NlpD
MSSRQVTHVARIVLIAVTLPSLSYAQQMRMPPFIEARVAKPPTVATGSEGSFLLYELHVTSFEPKESKWMTLEVIDVPSGKTLLTESDSTLWATLTRPGSPTPVAERSRLGAGQRVVAYIRVPLGAGTAPSAVTQRLTLTRGDSSRTLETATTMVAPAQPPIGAPLRGGPWVAGNGPSNTSGHRRAMIPVEGTAHIAQRFAIDYIKVDSAGRTFSGDSLKNESYYAEGLDALAVNDGVVVAVKDGIPENVPGITSRAVPITMETVGGNHVIIDIGGGRYAFYAHLKPGSPRVRVGQRVRRGDVLGLVGNTGNSTEPHLHFHVADGNSPLGSEGLPYLYATFEIVGSCNGITGVCAAAEPRKVQRAIPLENQIVRFP